MRPVVYLITDRRRAGDGWETRLPARVEAAARAGIDLVQVREADLDGGALVRLVDACMAAVAGTRTRVLVNDRLDVALAASAHGVHLRGDAPDARRVRAMTPRGFLVGRSVHSAAEAHGAAAGGGLDYLMFGTVFATGSKPGRAPCGPGVLAEAAAAAGLPVLAVGGITLDRVPAVAAAGAAGVAAVGLFAEGETEGLRRTAAAIRRMFDTSGGDS